MPNLICYCSIAIVACIWYIDFLSPTVFGIFCRCNLKLEMESLGINIDFSKYCWGVAIYTNVSRDYFPLFVAGKMVHFSKKNSEPQGAGSALSSLAGAGRDGDGSWGGEPW